MHIRSISEVFTDFQASLNKHEVTVADILEALHERGFGFLLLLFAIPAMLPVPGLNVIFAAPLVFLTAQQAIGRGTIWMPEKLKAKHIPLKTLNSLLDSAIPWLRRLEFIFRPRFAFATHGVFSNVIGLLGLIMALAAMLPIPLTHTVPSFGIALMAIGVIMRDGLAVLGGAVIGTAWVFMLVFAALFFGAEGLDILKETIKSFL